ncbi:MAG: Endonuclease [uncultured Sulfurovum sp.]|uniref:Endonuclease n=1 Tax=uncultured Sulfurovum sp. TaxID=269237 RepID=A0A6S6SH97_9BACT|nr:MAG: Endonuclease [uncultured Sulfurovum sp.]
MSSYEEVKEFVFNRLTKKYKVNGQLAEDDISYELENVQKILLSDNKKLVFDDIDIDLSKNDFERMKRELETSFDVKMEEGLLIQGEEQQDRDNSWWTGVVKQDIENYYWYRYKKYLKKSLPTDVVRTIDIDTDIIMNNIENPRIDNFNRYGMVVGHVQSGKTANYSSLICKAADAGYKFIVVIAGGINNLRNQTQERINESFVGRDKGNPIGVGIGDSSLNKLPISLTTKEKDFDINDANRNSQGTNFETNTTPILLVIKKNTRTLDNVIKWLEEVYNNKISNHAMLMVDDESDYASINTKDEEDPTAINKKLRKLLSLFHKSVYVAYTATPYANIFIDHEAGHDNLGRDLFPKDFIYALNAPDNYFGARKIFLGGDRKYLVTIDDYLDDIPSKHKKDFELPSIPQSLYDAMRVFVINIAIRSLRGQEKSHNSMLIHATRFTDVHRKFALHVEEYINSIVVDINSYGRLENSITFSCLIQELKNTFELRYINLEFSWDEVLERICSTIETVVVREVHQKTSVPLEYRKDRVTNAIVIGGTSLSRGYTLEGLSVSYFLRNTVFYDTLMQMGRWFGYRVGYEDICRVYMPESMIDNFGRIIEATEDLVKDFKLMSEANKTPNDFGLAVKQHPDSVLQVTARNKQKNVQEFIFNMKLDGQAKETSWLSSSIDDRKNNLLVVETIVKKLQDNYQVEYVGNNLLWRSVDRQNIIEFLNNFKVYQTDALGISARMPIAFVEKYAKTRNIVWDVALYSGKGESYIINDITLNKEVRQATLKNNDYIEIKNRQVSTGNSESIALDSITRKNLGSNRKVIRKNIKNPLLQLHILETNEDSTLVAFGISFPGDILSNDETINMKINTVYYKSLLEDLEVLSDD